MMKYLVLSISLICSNVIFCQSDFYNSEVIQEINIYFQESNWDEVLDDLYVAGQKERLLANIEINGERIDSVGIRYKGFSSVSVDRKKNPFNIKLDYTSNQKYKGIDKIKLGNVIQDPSFLREVLSYEISRSYMPASEANFSRVYINDEYWGLYTNVEAVNKEFISKHFESNNNTFFKCNPEDLDFDGENANLSDSPGTDTTSYYNLYDIESDEGWTDLYQLIDILNNNPTSIETILNVDRTLWMHALNYTLLNFDSYIGFAQNYYLYQDNNGQFNPILWDLNQSFASFRLTDASDFFDGFSVQQAAQMDPLAHYNSFSVLPRPLMRKLFENDTYRKMYIAHIKTITEEYFANGRYLEIAENLNQLIKSDVESDPNKFYSNEDFVTNIYNKVTDLAEYPGIQDLCEARTNYLQNYPGYNEAPNIVDHMVSKTSSDGLIEINAENATNISFFYRRGGTGLFNQENITSTSGQFNFTINNISDFLEYYFFVENDDAGVFSPERAAYEFHTVTFETSQYEGLVINELLASNDLTNQDENGEYDDWVELYNNGTNQISANGLYLSDDINNLKKWSLSTELNFNSDSYYLIWCDNDEEQGDNHSNFKLSSNGETILLSSESGKIIDSITYNSIDTDISFARNPNGFGNFTEAQPTPNLNNNLVNTTKISEAAFSVYPNPSNTNLNIAFNGKAPKEIHFIDSNGRTIYKKQTSLASQTININTSNYHNGQYIIKAVYQNHLETVKVSIVH